MPINLYLPPPNCAEMVSQNLDSLNVLVQPKQEEALTMSKLLPVYDVHFSDELKRGNIHPKITGWRCFIAQNDEVISMADIAVNEKSESPRFLYFTKGKIVEKILSKISEIEGLEVFKEDRFDVRILRISAINLIAIWLHGSNRDLIYPIDKKLNDHSPYSFSQIFESIAEQLRSIDVSGSLTPPL